MSSEPYEYRRKIARDSIAACSGDVRVKIDAAEELILESNKVSREAKEMFKQAEELKQKAKSMWYQGHNEMMEQTGHLPGNEGILFTFAHDMRTGEWGPSNYKKAIEIYTSFIDQKNEKYADDSLFWLATMHLKGKCDDDQNAQNTEPMLRKENLSNIAAADACAKKFELSNPSLYKKYLDKKTKYLNVYSGW
jgi:hypothetical protein